MEHVQKRISYTSTNSYETLNELTDQTKNVWFALHGMGFLSRFFLRPFQQLDKKENFVVAPQAPSKYYLKDEYKYVGASWLTKEDTAAEIENNMAYLDAVFEAEQLSVMKNMVFFGFSQGVSIITRFMCKRQLQPAQLVLYAGGIPKEITAKDFGYLDFEQTKIKMIYGDKDHFLTQNFLDRELNKVRELFGEKAEVIRFSGGHEIKPELLKSIV